MLQSDCNLHCDSILLGCDAVCSGNLLPISPIFHGKLVFTFRVQTEDKDYMFVRSLDTYLPNYTQKTVSQILYWNLYTYTSGFLTSSVIVVIVDLQGKTGIQSSVRIICVITIFYTYIGDILFLNHKPLTLKPIYTYLKYYLYSCTVHFEDSLSTAHQQMH